MTFRSNTPSPVPPADPAPERGESPHSEVQEQTEVDERKWIVLGEDDEDMRELLRHVLEEQGFRVTATRDGSELAQAITKAIEPQNDVQPDLVISDVRMPKVSGLSVLKELRQAGLEIPVIMITAFPDRETKRSIDLLEAKLLSKPFPVHELVRYANEVLS